MPTLLHVGCGPATLESLKSLVGSDGKPLFDGWSETRLDSDGKPLFDGWSETRLDIDDQYSPDIIGDARDWSTWKTPSGEGADFRHAGTRPQGHA